MKLHKNLFPLTFFVFSIVLFVLASIIPGYTRQIVCTDTNLYFKSLVFAATALLIIFFGIKSRLFDFGAGLLLAGGFVILLESFTRGCVIDYLPFFGLFKFNFSDLALCIGAICIVISIFSKRRNF